MSANDWCIASAFGLISLGAAFMAGRKYAYFRVRRLLKNLDSDRGRLWLPRRATEGRAE